MLFLVGFTEGSWCYSPSFSSDAAVAVIAMGRGITGRKKSQHEAEQVIP